MKKLIKNFSKDFPPVRLYLEDLVEIENVLKKICKNIEISTEDHVLENLLEDLKKINKDKISSLHFHCSDPYITLDFNKSSIRTYVWDQDNLTAMGALLKIESILKKRIAFTKYLSLNPNSKFYWFFFFPLIVLVGSGKIGIPKHELFFNILFLGAFILWFFASFIFSFKEYTIIYLMNRSDHSNIFVRNKDQLFVNFLCILAGIILTLFFQAVFKIKL